MSQKHNRQIAMKWSPVLVCLISSFSYIYLFRREYMNIFSDMTLWMKTDYSTKTNHGKSNSLASNVIGAILWHKSVDTNISLSPEDTVLLICTKWHIITIQIPIDARIILIFIQWTLYLIMSSFKHYPIQHTRHHKKIAGIGTTVISDGLRNSIINAHVNCMYYVFRYQSKQPFRCR